MKRYKLLKDTPTLKAGTIFEEVVSDFDGLKGLARITPIGTKTSPQFTINDIDNFDEWFEEIPKNKRWRAEYNEKYWCNDGNGGIYSSTEDGHKADSYRFLTGNYFKTEEEAEVYKEYLIARQVLLDDAKGGKWKKREVNFYVYYDYNMKKWIVDYDIEGMQTIGAIYFQDEEDAEDSLEEHKKQWEIVRKYEMGEM